MGQDWGLQIGNINNNLPLSFNNYPSVLILTKFTVSLQLDKQQILQIYKQFLVKNTHFRLEMWCLQSNSRRCTCSPSTNNTVSSMTVKSEIVH